MRKRWIQIPLLLIVAAVFIFSGAKVVKYYSQASANANSVEELAETAVVRIPPAQESPNQKLDSPALSAEKPGSEESTPEEEQEAPVMTAPLKVDFAALQAECGDIAAWIYCEDTPIYYPVAQSSDNDYYLHRLTDGTYNSGGTLFLDYRNARDFSDFNSVIYGHNMNNGSMFGTLDQYKSQEYFDAHPTMFFFTPGQAWLLELFAGYVTESTSDSYTNPQKPETRTAFIEKALERSDFVSGVAVSETDHCLTLSTCSYEYGDARYVVVGKLTPIEAP